MNPKLKIEKVSVVGLGKLGLSLAAVLASRGFRVSGVDVDKSKIRSINKGVSPLYEPGLGELIKSNSGRLTATLKYEDAIQNTDATFVVVPTPSDRSGEFSLKFVRPAMESIGKVLSKKGGYHLVVLTSTVMPGSLDGQVRPLLEKSSSKVCGKDFGLCYNPDFIALGDVINGLLKPDIILIGGSDSQAGANAFIVIFLGGFDLWISGTDGGLSSDGRAQMSDRFVEYWERAVPWTFRTEKLTYEERRALRYSLQDYMQDAIRFDEFGGRLVLEIGSGSGIDSAEFSRHGARVVSLDFTQTGVVGTRNLLVEAGLTPGVVRASANLLPFKDSAFDTVYSFGVLHHIPEVGPVVAEIARTVKPAGEVILMLYNKRSLLYAYSILFSHRDEGLSEDQLVSQYSERILGCPYTKAYTREEAVALLSPFFDHIAVSVHFNALDLPGQRKFKLNIPDKYELGWHLLVRARRRT